MSSKSDRAAVVSGPTAHRCSPPGGARFDKIVIGVYPRWEIHNSCLRRGHYGKDRHGHGVGAARHMHRLPEIENRLDSDG
jgi:hypothetical protein